MKQLNIKPNYSDLSRRYSLDRHTIKKYYDEGGKIKDRNYLLTLIDKLNITFLMNYHLIKTALNQYNKYHFIIPRNVAILYDNNFLKRIINF